MTMQSMITIVAPIPRERVSDIRAKIDTRLGNPACQAFRDAVNAGGPFLHFASLHALAGCDGNGAHLILEFSADGGEDIALALLAERAGALLEPVFQEATDWMPQQDILAYWRAHKLKIGFGLFSTVGLAFCGTPGQDVASIEAERALADESAKVLAGMEAATPPLAKLRAVRARLAASDTFKWALKPAPPAIQSRAAEPGAITKVFLLAPSFVATFLWPLILVLLPLCAWLAWPGAWVWTQWPAGETIGLPEWFGAIKQVAGFLAATLALLVAFLVLVLGLTYFAFARQEARDWLSDRAPDPAEHVEMTRRENAAGFAQNHMVSHTMMKPGFIRMLTVRLAFWAIAKLTAFNPKPGHLGDIGTIHFARWVNVPGTRDFLFFSNFGGSWESYLEDFITKAHAGLTAVWSNTVGFPRTRNLFSDGATDGERFKRYARQSMVHTPFWYCAYPTLTTVNIRTNRLIRRGIAAAMTEGEAVEWLAHFGSAPRPAEKLETTQIQSLIFGGMGFKPDGRLVLVDLGDDIGRNKAWLGKVLPHVAFNDGRYATQDALISLAVSPSGLAKLGLERDALASFPAAFIQGMHGEGRDRILGDLDANHRDHWWWGQDGDDIALLIYGNEPDAAGTRPIDGLERTIEDLLSEAGGRIVHKVELTPVSKNLSDRKEPFGFVDGVSQPAMRGTYRGLRNDDPIHLVEPGEFVLGYPDNRGNIPPGPTMDARHDPGLHLPISGRAQGFAETVAENPRLVGYNGSFLVIRQLEQHVDRFRDYCRAQAEKLEHAFPDLPLPTGADSMADFVGAKMIGRWQDGSSLVRNPYLSASTLKKLTSLSANEGTSRSESSPTDPAAPSIDAPTPHPKKPEAAVNAKVEPTITIKIDNDFLFGTEDPQGVRCPYGSHIRRANPRESLSPGSNDQIDISNRHRILRVGRGYLGEDGKTTKGLLFMCLNGDIERQFEFIQQTWMGSIKFHGLTAESDPIAGRARTGEDGFTIPTRRGPIGLSPMPQFVTMRGGGYFFLPGRQLLGFLAEP